MRRMVKQRSKNLVPSKLLYNFMSLQRLLSLYDIHLNVNDKTLPINKELTSFSYNK